jgi:hypothetical protein
MAASDEIRKLREESSKAKAAIEDLLKGETALGAKAVRATDEYKKQLEVLTQAEKRIKEIRNQHKETIDSLQRQEQSLKSIDGFAKSIVSMDRERIRLQDELEISDSKAVESINTIIDKRDELLKLSYEDQISRKNISEEITQEIEQLRQMGGQYAVIADNLEKQYITSANLARLTENEQKVLNKQISAYQGIQDTLGAAFGTAGLLFSSVGSFVGLATIGFGQLVGSVGKVNKELGTSFTQITGIAGQAGLVGIFFDDAAANAKALAQELGGVQDISTVTLLNMSLVANAFGISGTEASSLLGSFSRLNGNSTDIAENMLATSRQFAIQNGIIPAQLMGQLAGATEEFALFGEKGGENILRAAGYAAKLGVEMGTISGIADNLLDFESSITKELELGAMLGRNINLNKARQLAYEGRLGEATLETLKAVGGIQAFNQMDYFARKQTAATLGVTVAQLQKMTSLQEKGVDLSSVTAENFDSIGVGIEGFVNKYGGMLVESLGTLIMMGTQLRTNFLMRRAINREATQTLATDTQNMFVQSKSGKFFPANSPQGKMIRTNGGTTPLPQQSVASQANKTGGGINMKSVLQGAAAMLILAGALFVFAKAAQEFGEVPSWSDVFIGIGAMATLGAVAAVLGFGPIAEAAVVGTLIILGLASAFAIFGAGAMLFAGAVNIISNSLQPMADGLTSLIGLVPGIFGLAAALATLGGSLAILGATGSLALPVLAALGGLGFVAGMIFGDNDGESGEEDGVTLSVLSKNITDKLDEVKLAINNINLNIDGEKLTSYTAAKQEKLPIKNRTNIRLG